MIGGLTSRLRQAEKFAASYVASKPRDLSKYRNDPVGYVKDVLGIPFMWDKVEDVLRSLLTPPYRTLVDSGHDVGKTHAAACAANWWYDTRDPGVVISTAPTERDVVDLLWTEIRLQRQRAGLPMNFIGPRAPSMRTSEDHYAKGYTARTGESFQGRHRENMLFIFDEAEGIGPSYWTTTKTMCDPSLGCAWLAIGNPTTTTSQSYQEESAVGPDGEPSWRLFNLDALEHPNIAAELAGLPRPVPSAVSTALIDTWVSDFCDELPDGDDRLATDFEWRGRVYRPGPIGESRIRGRRPSSGTYGVWSDSLWAAAETTRLFPGPHDMPEIGCDVARYGDDFTELHVRWGPCSFWHEAHNGWSTVRTFSRLKELAEVWANHASNTRPPQAARIDPRHVRIKVDDDGIGGAVSDMLKADRYCAIPVVAQTPPIRPDLYPQRRDENWFATANRARYGRLDLTRLPPRVRRALKVQAMAPEYWPDTAGRRKVEPKDETKEKLGRSPDGMDAVNLAYCEGLQAYTETVAGNTSADKRRHLGRGG